MQLHTITYRPAVHSLASPLSTYSIARYAVCRIELTRRPLILQTTNGTYTSASSRGNSSVLCLKWQKVNSFTFFNPLLFIPQLESSQLLMFSFPFLASFRHSVGKDISSSHHRNQGNAKCSPAIVLLNEAV